MASEYLKWKYRDVKPDEPPPPMSRKDRLANWFHYYKWWVALWIFLLFTVGGMVWRALGIGQVRPDYIFAYVADAALPEDCVTALERELAALGQDVNRDGRVVVELRQYISNEGQAGAEDVMMYGYAADVTLVSDITKGESYFFLVKDPEEFQRVYMVLADLEGAMPETWDHSADGRVLRWSDCPVPARLDLGGYEEEHLGQTFSGECQDLLADLYIGRRGFYDGEQSAQRQAGEDLWNILIEGAVS